eukprot:4109559-Amphidinium_carterae.1
MQQEIKQTWQRTPEHGATEASPVPTTAVLHNCLFQADLKTPFIQHLRFEFDRAIILLSELPPHKCLAFYL